MSGGYACDYCEDWQFTWEKHYGKWVELACPKCKKHFEDRKPGVTKARVVTATPEQVIELREMQAEALQNRAHLEREVQTLETRRLIATLDERIANLRRLRAKVDPEFIKEMAR